MRKTLIIVGIFIAFSFSVSWILPKIMGFVIAWDSVQIDEKIENGNLLQDSSLVNVFEYDTINENDKKYINKLLYDNELNNQNIIKKYSAYNFSEIWLKTDNVNVFGIIGKENQRIRIKMISINKDKSNPQKYIIKGKSNVKGNICDFNGVITLLKVYNTKELDYGVDDKYKDKGIKYQGVLIANYELAENIKQTHSGKFSGKLYSKWYLNSDNKIKYDDISNIADGYTNNIFVGKWESYKTHTIKKCNWGDFRVPDATSNFDIGAGEFSPSPKFYDKGWESRAKIYSDDKAKIKEMEIWWK